MASSQLKHARRTSLQRDQKILTIELKHVFARHRRANSISADLTDLIGGAGGQQLDYDLVPFSPGQASWSWLDQSALPVVSASSAAITDAEAGTYTALVFAGMTGVSAVAFTILGDAAAEFNVNVDAAGSGVGERDNGSRSIGG
jgi:hypothetical protein